MKVELEVKARKLKELQKRIQIRSNKKAGSILIKCIPA